MMDECTFTSGCIGEALAKDFTLPYITTGRLGPFASLNYGGL